MKRAAKRLRCWRYRLTSDNAFNQPVVSILISKEQYIFLEHTSDLHGWSYYGIVSTKTRMKTLMIEPEAFIKACDALENKIVDDNIDSALST